jgi:hypothetical protein
MTEKKTGVDAVKAAKLLAKAHGVEVLAWNDKVGKEFIFTEGDGDKLELLRKDLEKDGWIAWPMDEEQEGYFQDFAMYPPDRSPKKSEMLEEERRGIAFIGSDFRYRGFTPAFLGTFLFAAFICSFAIRLAELPLLSGPQYRGSASMEMTAAAGAFIALVYVAIGNWTSVYADGSSLNVRHGLYARPLTIPLSEIKKIRIYKSQYARGIGSTLVALNLNSGKAYDLQLPGRARRELVAFVKSRIPFRS